MEFDYEVELESGIVSCKIVYDNNGDYITEEGKILMMRSDNQSLLFIPFNIEASESGVQKDSVQSSVAMKIDKSPSLLLSDTEQVNDSALKKVQWTRLQILELINLFKDNKTNYDSSTMKHEKVWLLIAANFPQYTTIQVKNKWKYLKSKYFAKIDNMSVRKTGDPIMEFKYFDLMNEIYGKDPNVKPLSIASSSRGIEIAPAEEPETAEVEDNPESPPAKKKKIEKQNKWQSREAGKQQRHDIIIDRQDKALALLSKIADAFEKIANK